MSTACSLSTLHSACLLKLAIVRPLQVPIPVVTVRLVKKHKTAGLVPNGLAITTDTGQKVTLPPYPGLLRKPKILVCRLVQRGPASPGEGVMERNSAAL